MSITSHSNLRLNVLAAALAMALPLGAAADAGVGQAGPRSNRPAGAMATRVNRPFGTYNHANTSSGAPASSLAVASTLLVSSCLDDGSAGTLRTVMGTAVDGDTIDLSQLNCSTITLQSGTIAFRAKNLTIQGPGSKLLAINGNANGRIFNAVPTTGLDQNLTATGLSLTNGNSTYGGCVYVGGNLSLTDVTVSGCVSLGNYAYGGGVDVKGNLSLDSSTISGNSANGASSAEGGGVYVGGAVTLANGSVVSNNQALGHGSKPFNAAIGGGIFVFGGMSISNSVVEGNLAHAYAGQAYGGGIALVGPRNLTMAAGTILDSTVSGNTAQADVSWSYGGGVQAGIAGYANQWFAGRASLGASYSTIAGNAVKSNCASCVLTGGGAGAFGPISIDHSTVSGNTVTSTAGLSSSAVAYGGGLATRNSSNGLITLRESTLSGNAVHSGAGSAASRGEGGGAAALLSPVSSANGTIAANYASTTAGGLLIGAATSSLQSTIVATNQAPAAADIAAFVPTSNKPTLTISGDHDLIVSVSNNVQLPAGTLQVDPQLQPLAFNGGTTQTHALRSTSPAIDTGSNPNSDLCDQRGGVYKRSSGGGVDIGALESQVDLIFADGFEIPSGCH